MAIKLSNLAWRLDLDRDSQKFYLIVSGGALIRGRVRGKARGIARSIGGRVDHQSGQRSIGSRDLNKHAASALIDRIGAALMGNKENGVTISERFSHRAIL